MYSVVQRWSTFSTYTMGMSLGVVHAILGLLAFPAGYLLLTRKARARTITVGVDAAIMAFSIVSEIILSTTESLPSGPFIDSIVGTAVAVVIAAIILYPLMTSNISPVNTVHTHLLEQSIRAEPIESRDVRLE